MNNIEIFKLESYVRPDIVEKQGKEWVLNGENNQFYQYIIDRYNGSPTNSAIIDAYSQMIYGLGLNLQIPLLPKKEVRRIVKDFTMFGMASFEVMYLQGEPVKIVHVPTEKLAPEKADEEGNITGYWYSYDWNKQTNYPPKRMDAFGFGTGSKRSEIFVIKDYQVGQFYFSNPSYLSALPYAELEEEIANFCINYVKNKFNVGTIINVNNGIPESEEERGKISRQYKNTSTTTDNAGAVVVAFNENKENATTVEQIQIVDGYLQYEFVSKHAQDNICTAHKLVSKSMIGISTASGFSSNADEIQMAFDETMMNVIQPKQEIILDAFQQIASMVGVETNLDFLSLRPKVKVVQPNEQLSLSAQLLIDLGEDIDIDGYELESVKPVDYTEEDAIKMASTGVAFPNRKSIYDTEFYLHRYRYAGNIAPEREFCVKMMQANKIYRREDIEAMGSVVVNAGFGMHPNPDNPYSIWLYKGGGLLSANHPGGTCKHYWEKLTFKKKDVKVDTKSPIAIDESKKQPASGIAGRTPFSLSKILKFFNENRDEIGRFASGDSSDGGLNENYSPPSIGNAGNEVKEGDSVNVEKYKYLSDNPNKDVTGTLATALDISGGNQIYTNFGHEWSAKTMGTGRSTNSLYFEKNGIEYRISNHELPNRRYMEAHSFKNVNHAIENGVPTNRLFHKSNVEIIVKDNKIVKINKNFNY